MTVGLEEINLLHLSGKLYASVVVSAYNRLEALKMCLTALLHQTIESDKYEIILVDDCSTDGTKDYLDKIKNTETNIKYIRHEVNQGLASARNSGIRSAVGEYIIFLDGDIVPEPDFIEKMLFYHAQYLDEKIVVIGNLRFYKNLTDKNNIAYFSQSRYLGFRTKKEMAEIDYSNFYMNLYLSIETLEGNRYAAIIVENKGKITKEKAREAGRREVYLLL